MHQESDQHDRQQRVAKTHGGHPAVVDDGDGDGALPRGRTRVIECLSGLSRLSLRDRADRRNARNGLGRR